MTMPDRIGPASRTGQICHDLRRMPLFRQLAPMEAGIGWPIPIRHRLAGNSGNSVYLRIPLYGFESRGGRVRLYPPFAVITLAWVAPGRRPRPLEYADLRFTRPWAVNGSPAAVGDFPHAAVRGTVAEYLAQRNRLFALYDELLDTLREGAPFADPSYGEFAALFRVLMEPSLVRYYRSLAPKFCQEFLGQSDDDKADAAS
jgi:hypothetical protein